MSQDPQKYPLPFLTRDMLNFEGSAAFGLTLKLQTVIAGAVLIRGFTKQGPFTLRAAGAGDGTVASLDFRLPDMPVLISVTDTDQNFTLGDAYASLSLTINGEIVYTLCSGYVHTNKSISWPTSDNPGPRPGQGAIREKQSVDPAANAEATITVPTGEIWKILSGTVTLVTDANAANRRVHIVFPNTSFGVIRCFASTDQAASLTRIYSIAAYPTELGDISNTTILIPIPPNILLTEGYTIETQTFNRQVGDNFGKLGILYERFLTGI